MEHSVRPTRRRLLQGIGAAAGAVGLTLLSGWTGAKFAHDYEARHDLSISVIKSGNAAPPKVWVGDDPLFNPFGFGGYVEVIDPNGSYDYAFIARNVGDYPEVNVEFAVAVDLTSSPNPNEAPDLVDTSVDASSDLVRQTIGSFPSDQTSGGAVRLTIPRLNPGEWVSVSSKWTRAVHFEIVVRSENVTDSTSV